jgi:hypothetical protein
MILIFSMVMLRTNKLECFQSNLTFGNEVGTEERYLKPDVMLLLWTNKLECFQHSVTFGNNVGGGKKTFNDLTL